MHFKDEQGHDNGNNAIAKGFKTVGAFDALRISSLSHDHLAVA